MNILVIGSGYVGTTTSLVFAEFGHHVTALDIDENKIQNLRQGKLYFYEPGLQEILEKQLINKSITFTTDFCSSIEQNDVIFICVGTPSNKDGSANMSYIQNVSEQIGTYMNKYKTIVIKSTVPILTNEKVYQWIKESQKEAIDFDVVSNPEFLREGSALKDTMQPDRIIIGSTSDYASKLISSLYQSTKCPIFITTPRTSELIKYASNCFLATKISFINELARLCDKVDVSIKDIAYGIGLDQRIGHSFLQAGIGYGGSCFPKDVDALLQTSKQFGVPLTILEKVVTVNNSQYVIAVDKLRKVLGSLKDKKIVILGLAFKANTDDIRESPSLSIINKLLSENAYIHVHDPVAVLPDYLKDVVVQHKTAEDAILTADAIILCTEWDMYNELDWNMIKKNVKQHIIIDGRNMFDADKLKQLGFYYEGVAYS